MRLVPSVARHCCYRCGRQLLQEEDKYNCRMCYDVFCKRCWGHRVMLTEYGYTGEQRVCDTCNLLLEKFPGFLSRINDDVGGLLLLSNQRAVIAAQVTDSGSGHLQHAKLNTRVRPTNAHCVTIHAFRPMNRETSVAIGSAVTLPVRTLLSIDVEGARVRVKHAEGWIDLVIAELEESAVAAAPPTLARRVMSVFGGNEDEDTLSICPDAAARFGAALAALVAHVRTAICFHPQFGRMSEATREAAESSPPSGPRSGPRSKRAA